MGSCASASVRDPAKADAKSPVDSSGRSPPELKKKLRVAKLPVAQPPPPSDSHQAPSNDARNNSGRRGSGEGKPGAAHAAEPLARQRKAENKTPQNPSPPAPAGPGGPPSESGAVLLDIFLPPGGKAKPDTPSGGAGGGAKYAFGSHIDLNSFSLATFQQGLGALERLRDSDFLKNLLESGESKLQRDKQLQRQHQALQSQHGAGRGAAKEGRKPAPPFKFWEHLKIPASQALPLLYRVKEAVDSVIYFVLLSALSHTTTLRPIVCDTTHKVVLVDDDGSPSGDDFSLTSLADHIPEVVKEWTTKAGKHRVSQQRFESLANAGFLVLRWFAYGTTLPVVAPPQCAAGPCGGGGGDSQPDDPIAALLCDASAFEISAARDACNLVLRNGRLATPSEGMLGDRALTASLASAHDVLSRLGVVLGRSTWEKYPSCTASCSRPADACTEWFQNLPLFAIGPAVKSDLLYVCSSVAQRKLPLTNLRRPYILEDASGFVQKAGAWGGLRATDFLKEPPPSLSSQLALLGGPVRGSLVQQHSRASQSTAASRGLDEDLGSFWKMFPTFSDTDGLPEQGEGHGPRKELFDLCAEAALSPWRRAVNISKKCRSAEVTEGSPVLTLHWAGEHLIVPVPQWCRLTIRGTSASEEFVAEVQSVEQRKLLFTVRLTEPAPFTSKQVTVGLSLRGCPLFVKGDEQHSWFNKDEELGTTPYEKLSEKHQRTLQQYGCLGWLAGQTFGNGVPLNFGLPPIFFELLRIWPEYDPSLEKGLGTTHVDLMATVDAIRKVPKDVFVEMLEAEGQSPNLSLDAYVSQYVKDAVFDSVFNQMSAFVSGFRSTKVVDYPVFQSLRAAELQLLLQGRVDDGTSDFSFSNEFIISHPEELRESVHNRIFKDVLWEVLEGGFGAQHPEEKARRKRNFLRFLTGRHLLPSHAKNEQLSIVLPYTIFNASVFAGSLNRLPVSHTCENTLELPNYIEGLIFGEEDEWYQKAGKEKGASVLQSHRVAAWELLSAPTKQRIITRLRDILCARFITAVENSDSYELDELEPVEEPPRREPQRPVWGTPSSMSASTTDTPSQCTHDTTTTNARSRLPDIRHSTRHDWDDEDDHLNSPQGHPSSKPHSLPNGTKLSTGSTKSESFPKAPTPALVDACSKSDIPSSMEQRPGGEPDPWDTEDLDQLLKNLESEG